jgi:flagellar motor switch/type III secretory pathway protein FliN
VRDDLGLHFSVVSCHGHGAEEALEAQGSDGLQVDCIFEDVPESPTIRLAISIGALETITREVEDQLSTTGDPRMAEAIKDVTIEVVAELGRAKIGLRNVLAWQVGQVVRLPVATDDPIMLRIAGTTKFTGRPVVSRGQLAVEIRGRAD